MRKDGFYINHKKGNDLYGQPFQLTSILMFTKNNLVFFETEDGFIEPEEIKDEILEMETGSELSSTLGKFDLNGNRIKITFPLKDISSIDKEYIELVGSYSENKMNLDYNQCNWSVRVEDYYKRTLIGNLEFKFYSLVEKKYIEDFPNPKANFERKQIDTLKDYSSEMKEVRQFNKERNYTIAFFFGLFGGVIGAIFSGFSGFIVGALVGVAIGFILKSILD
jgi:hypothetical protein